MSGEHPEQRTKVFPAWLVPWVIPVVLVLFVVSTVNVLLMLPVGLVVVFLAARWRYLEVREREAQGVHEWERWRTDAALRRAAAKYSGRH